MNEDVQQKKNELYTKEIDKETESSSMRRCAYIRLNKIQILKSFESTKEVVITVSLQKNRKEKLFSQPFSSHNGEPFTYDVNREFSLFYLHCVKYHRDPILRIALENTKAKTFTRHRSIAATLVSMQQVLQHKFKGSLTLYTTHNQQRIAIGFINVEISTEYLDDGDDRMDSSDEDEASMEEEVMEGKLTPTSIISNGESLEEVNTNVTTSNESNTAFHRWGETIKQMFRNYSLKEDHTQRNVVPEPPFPRDNSSSTISASSLAFKETMVENDSGLNEFINSLSSPDSHPFLFLLQNTSNCYKLYHYLSSYKNDDGIRWSQHLVNADEIAAVNVLQQLLTAYKTLSFNNTSSTPRILVYILGTDHFISKFISAYLSILSERSKNVQPLAFLPLPNGTIPVLSELFFKFSPDYTDLVTSLNQLLSESSYEDLQDSNKLYTIIQSLLASSTIIVSIPIGQAVLHYKDPHSETSHYTQSTLPFFYEAQFGSHVSLSGSIGERTYSFKHNVDIWINTPYSSSGTVTTKQITIPSNKLSSIFSYISRASFLVNPYEPNDSDSSFIYYHLYIPQSQKNKKKWFINKAFMTEMTSDSNPSTLLTDSNVLNTQSKSSKSLSSNEKPLDSPSKASHSSEDKNWMEAKIKKIVCTFDEPGEKIYIDGVEYKDCIVLEINGKWNSRIKELQFIVPYCLDNSI